MRAALPPIAVLPVLALLALVLPGVPARAQQIAPSGPAVPPAPATATPVPLTLADAFRRALEANPGLGRATAEVRVAEAQRDVLRSAVLPKLGFSGDFIRNSQEAAFGSGEDRRILLPAEDWSYRVTLSQPIFAGNRERRALSQATIGIESARLGERDARERLLLDVASDYFALLQSDALIEVERQNLTLAERRREQAQAFFEAGESTRVDTLRAEADIKGVERRLAEARRARDLAESRLRLALALESPIAARDPGVVLPPSRPDEAALLAEAEGRRPEVAQAAAAVEVAKLEVAKQRGAYLPVVTTDGAYVQQRSSFPTDSYGFLALRLNVPIFQGGEVGARVAIARERLHQAELDLDAVRREVREDVRRALFDLDTAEANLRLAGEQLAASEAQYQQSTELYQAQELTALDVQAAEASLADSRRAVAVGKLLRDVAELNVWAAAGLLEQTISPEGAQ